MLLGEGVTSLNDLSKIFIYRLQGKILSQSDPSPRLGNYYCLHHLDIQDIQSQLLLVSWQTTVSSIYNFKIGSP